MRTNIAALIIAFFTLSGCQLIYPFDEAPTEADNWATTSPNIEEQDIADGGRSTSSSSGSAQVPQTDSGPQPAQADATNSYGTCGVSTGWNCVQNAMAAGMSSSGSLTPIGNGCTTNSCTIGCSNYLIICMAATAQAPAACYCSKAQSGILTNPITSSDGIKLPNDFSGNACANLVVDLLKQPKCTNNL